MWADTYLYILKNLLLHREKAFFPKLLFWEEQQEYVEENAQCAFVSSQQLILPWIFPDPMPLSGHGA